MLKKFASDEPANPRPPQQARSLDQNRNLKTLAPKIVKYVDEEHGWNWQNHQTCNENNHLCFPLWAAQFNRQAVFRSGSNQEAQLDQHNGGSKSSAQSPERTNLWITLERNT